MGAEYHRGMGLPDRQDDHLLTIPGLAEADKIAICAAVKNGDGLAHALAGIGRFIDDHEIAMHEDPDYKREFEMCERLRDEVVENALHRKASRGNVPAIKFWLTNRQSNRWQDARTHRHVGADGGAIEVEHTVSALRQLITSPETRDEALGWIERNADVIDAETVPPGELPAGEDSEPGEAG